MATELQQQAGSIYIQFKELAESPLADRKMKAILGALKAIAYGEAQPEEESEAKGQQEAHAGP